MIFKVPFMATDCRWSILTMILLGKFQQTEPPAADRCCVMLCFSGARGKPSGANVMQTPEVCSCDVQKPDRMDRIVPKRSEKIKGIFNEAHAVHKVCEKWQRWAKRVEIMDHVATRIEKPALLRWESQVSVWHKPMTTCKVCLLINSNKETVL